jgi:hypothetical protein
MSWLLSVFGSAVGNWQRLAIYGLLAAFALSTAAGWGYLKGSERLWSYQADQARQAVKVVVKQGEATERVVVRFVKVMGATQVVTQTIEKEVIRYVDTNHGSCLDAGWRRLHDAAAANTIPLPTPGPDGAGGAPTAAETLEAVTGSYAACHRTADRLDALQAWVKAQAEVRP